MPHLVFSFCFCISQVNKLLIDAITFFREQNFQVLWGVYGSICYWMEDKP